MSEDALPPENGEDRILTTTEAAKIIGCGHTKLIELCDNGELPYHYAKTHRRIGLSDVHCYMDANHIPRDIQDEVVLGKADVGRVLHCTDNGVDAVCKNGLKHHYVGTEMRILQRDLREYMKAHHIPHDVASQIVLTTGEAASVMHCSAQTAYKLCEGNVLKHYRIGTEHRILARDLLTFMEKHNIPRDVAKYTLAKIDKVAAVLDCDEREVKRLCDIGALRHHDINGKNRVLELHLAEFMQGCEKPYEATMLEPEPVIVQKWQTFLQRKDRREQRESSIRS